MISFMNLSGSEEIGSNSYLLQLNSFRIILDAGMHPKKEGNAAKPNYELIGAAAPDAIFITHAHLDHIGTLPVLQDKYPRCEVVMTEGTTRIGSAMLHNSVNVMTSKRTQEGLVEYPFFTHDEVESCENQWIARPYDAPFRLSNGREEVLATLYDAGHILGSCGVMVESSDGHTLFYTGDVQFDEQTIIQKASFPTSGVDTLVIECTHGNTLRPEGYTRQKELARFAKAIRETIENDGAVLIPVFALGKSQELLYELGTMREQGIIPDVPIYFGGLSTKLTLIYDKMADTSPRRLPGMRLRETVRTMPLPRKGKGTLNASAGNIYLVSSGMMSEHTISHLLGEQILPRRKDCILFVGYSDPDSPAGSIKATEPGQLVRLRQKGGQAYPLNCRTERFDFSGHATREALVNYCVELSPPQIVLVHGDIDAMLSMKETLSELLPESEIIIPKPGVNYQLTKH